MDKYSKLKSIPMSELETIITQEFHEMLIYTIPTGFQLIMAYEIVMLKKTYHYEQEVINNTISLGESFKVYNDI